LATVGGKRREERAERGGASARREAAFEDGAPAEGGQDAQRVGCVSVERVEGAEGLAEAIAVELCVALLTEGAEDPGTMLAGTTVFTRNGGGSRDGEVRSSSGTDPR
jgi:hypothetical protein